MTRFDLLARAMDRLDIPTAHARLYRLLGGRLVGRDMLLLTTLGRRSGRRHTTPLFYARDGAGYVVIASNGGDDVHPGWWHNIRAHPEVDIQVGRRTIACCAAEAEPVDVPRLSAKLDAVYAGYESYRKRTSRELTIFRLTPRDGFTPDRPRPVVARLLMATAIGHALVGVALFREPLAAIFRAGVVGAIAPRSGGDGLFGMRLDFEGEAAFWFLLFSPMLFLLGQITGRAIERRDTTLLRTIGWSLAANGTVGVVVMPISGHWILIALAALVLRTASRTDDQPDVDPPTGDRPRQALARVAG